DRTDKQLKLLRIGWKIFRQLGEFAKSEEYSFEGVPGYDVTIRRVGQGLNTEYTVIPARHNAELTEKEQQLIKEKAKPPKDIIESMKAKAMTGTIAETIKEEEE
ncbi:unnamed protein product, partial [marine sediment metagenome]